RLRPPDRRTVRRPRCAPVGGPTVTPAPTGGGAAGPLTRARTRRLYHRRGVMLRRRRVQMAIAVLAAAAAVGVVWPLVALASSDHNAAILDSSTLVDATGDAFNDGPDLGTVTITDDSAGKI